MTKEEIIKEYNIDVSKLKRNYILHPLFKKDGFHLSEYPHDVDFKYLFIDCNVRRKDLSSFFNVSKHTIDNFVIMFNCKKSKKQSQINTKDTMIKRYGVDNIFKIEQIKQKQKQTCIKKYGVDNVSKLDSIKKKKIITTICNHTATTSSCEEIINSYLVEKFIDVKRQYQSDLYPFPCDFYIPSLNLYIEYQGTWSHGESKYHEPYDSLNPLHQQCLEQWKQKSLNSKRYKDAIKTWTIRDPLKRETAKKNNLNWIEFFTMEEFYDWYNKITLQA